MKCRIALALLVASMMPLAARAGDVRVVTAALLYETGQVAPAVDYRLVSDDGSLWRFAVEGWTLAATREKTMSKHARWFATLSATPHNAHSSERIYRGGARAHDLEFGDAAVSVQAGVRLSESDHNATDVSAIIGREIIGDDAPLALREDWRTPYFGMRFTHRLRFVTADDPLTARIRGVEIAATGEGFGGRRAWARGIVTEEAGWPAGPLHLRQSLALMNGSHLDTVSAFLTGGSWDVLRATTLYGTRFAEFRLNRGAIASVGADFNITRSLEVGLRASALRAPSLHKTGALVQLMKRTGGLQISIGAGKSDGRTTIMASVGGAVFR